MKNLSISLKASGSSFSLSYHYHIQGFIYKLLSGNKDYSDFLHENGYMIDGKTYKLFTFSSLRGPKTIRKDYMYFPDFVFLDIRSVSDVFSDCLAQELEKHKSVEIMENILSVRDVQIRQPEIKDDSISITFLSPVTAHISLGDSGQTEFLTPFDPRFEKHIDHNFRRKYKAYYDSDPDSGVLLQAEKISRKDKYVTWFKKSHITGWRGLYRLSGSAEYLTFLYYTRLGSYNSAGFGMFSVEEKA